MMDYQSWIKLCNTEHGLVFAGAEEPDEHTTIYDKCELCHYIYRTPAGPYVRSQKLSLTQRRKVLLPIYFVVWNTDSLDNILWDFPAYVHVATYRLLKSYNYSDKGVP